MLCLFSCSGVLILLTKTPDSFPKFYCTWNHLRIKKKKSLPTSNILISCPGYNLDTCNVKTQQKLRAKTTSSNNLHLRFEDLQLREDVLLYPGVRCGCESHHWNGRKLLAKHIHPFVILTKIMTPLIGKKYCSRLSVSLFCEGQHWSIERKHFTLP